jgi:NADH-quinone oxidoreductase subunit J
MNEMVAFFLFGGIALVGAVNTIFRRHPVHAALFLVSSFLGVAGLFLTLGAGFLAAIQVLVYAGAIMVLFLFLILLLNLEVETQEGPSVARAASLLAAIATIALVLYPLVTSGEGQLKSAPEPTLQSTAATPINVGQFLFREYVLPFELISLLLLVAMVGAIHLARRPQRAELL